MPQVNIGGDTIHYAAPRELGSSERGARILFIHGPGVDHRLFEGQLRFFAPSQTPIAPDLLGHGQSSGDALEEVVEWASFLDDFIGTLGLAPVILCGHALGGAIALEYAHRFPNKVEALTLIGTGVTFPWAADAAADLAADPAGYRERNATRGLREPPLPQPAEALTAARMAQRPETAIRDLVAAAKWDGRPRLASIQAPTHIIFGEEDPLVEQAGELLGGIQQASFDTIPLARHFPHVEMQDIFNDSLNRFVTVAPDLSFVAGGE